MPPDLSPSASAPRAAVESCLGTRHLIPQGVWVPDLHLANCVAHPHHRQPQPRTDAVRSCWDQSCRSRPSSAQQMACSAAFVFGAYLPICSSTPDSHVNLRREKKKRLPQELIKKKSRSFLSTCYLTVNIPKKHSEPSLKGERPRNELRKAPWCPSSMDSSVRDLTETQGDTFSPEDCPDSNILAGFQFLHNEEQVFSTWSFSFKYLKGGKTKFSNQNLSHFPLSLLGTGMFWFYLNKIAGTSAAPLQ